MNKIIVLLAFLALFLCSHDMHAQMNGGSRGGLNFARFVGADATDMLFRIDYHLGGYLQYEMDDGYGIRIEAIFSRRGSAQSMEPDTMSTRYFHFYFMDFPLLLSYQIKKISISGGLSPGVLLRAELHQNDEESDIEDLYNPFSLSAVAGTSYQLSKSISVGGRAEYGLLSLVDENIVVETRASSLNLQLYLEYTVGNNK